MLSTQSSMFVSIVYEVNQWNTFYSRRTNECKECLKEKIKCEVCLHHFTRSNMNHHIQKKHMWIQPEVEKLCSEASSNSSPNVNVCGFCGETKELPVFRTICKDCINQKLREKVNCEKCILSKRHWYTHRRLCDPTPGVPCQPGVPCLGSA